MSDNVIQGEFGKQMNAPRTVYVRNAAAQHADSEQAFQVMVGLAATFEDHIRWTAQIVHQAYHGDDNPTTWQTCPKSACKETQRTLGLDG